MVSLLYYVYILRCEDNSLYTGITTDVKRRFYEHLNGKGAKYTKSHKPTKIESVWKISSKSDALKLEYQIKQCSKTTKEELINNKIKLISINNELSEIIAQKVAVCEIFNKDG